MNAAAVQKDKRGRLMFSQDTTSLQEILGVVDEEFKGLAPEIRYERIIVEGPITAFQLCNNAAGFLFVGLRDTPSFSTSGEFCIRAHRSLAAIMEAARTSPHCDFSKMKLKFPYAEPDTLLICT